MLKFIISFFSRFGVGSNPGKRTGLPEPKNEKTLLTKKIQSSDKKILIGLEEGSEVNNTGTKIKLRFDYLENSTENTEISAINQALEEYNTAYASEINKDIKELLLNEVIEMCEEYMETIPIQDRERKVGDKRSLKDMLSKAWPLAVPVINLQKKAVSLLYLPDAESDAKARWQLIRGLLVDRGSQPTGYGKILDEKYWGEFKFEGDTFIADWIQESSDVYEYSKDTLYSLSELCYHHEKEVSMIDIAYVDYLKDDRKSTLEDYRLTPNENDKGKFDFGEKLIDTTNSYGKDIRYGVVIFAAGTDGSIYTSDPDECLTRDFHHSTFLRGKPVLCAGTLKFKEGKLTEITIDSGHYKPHRKNLLRFLKLLKNKYKLNLSEIHIRDRKGFFRNAARYYKTQGICLPDNQVKLMLGEANKALKYIEDKKKFGIKCEKKDHEVLHFYLDKAVTLGSRDALFKQAEFMARENNGYVDTRVKGIEMLRKFGEDHPKYSSDVKRILIEVVDLKKMTDDSFEDIDTEKEGKSKFRTLRY